MFDSGKQYPDTWYAATSRDRQTERAPLPGDRDVDVLVVGAGFSGLYTAHNLADKGQSVAVIEASRVGWAASGRCGGQIILGLSCDMGPIEAALGRDGAREVWDLLRWAGGEIRHKIQRHAIDCELADGFLWTSILWQRIKLLCDWQEEAARHYGYDKLQFLTRRELPDHVGSERYVAGLIDPEGGHLHPLKYILGLAAALEAKGVPIYENTRALSYRDHGDGCTVETEHGVIRCRKLVLAANAYIDKLDPTLHRRVMPVGTYMIATEPLPVSLARQLLPSNMAVCDNQFVLDYFRLTADNTLLFGGKCTYSGRTPANLTESMRADMLRVFPQLKGTRISHTWGGHIDITVNRTPDLGQRGNVYWAQGFSGHGVVPTCAAGKVLADAILGEDHLLRQFMRLSNPAFPGGDLLRVPLQAGGMFYYRLRDYAIPGISF
ncbi:FAD-binding oxidoreductase [uncultured Aquitalea sp.]|uniref:NAD(P)/FAD-dependent oxidoreductase n=1 Tax=uncultured Aquitalea sp. TaxID=540272 RepID=UPI0025CFE5A2|nr:FAD-binding oxidoreductase [uncultured Aquitalea sp.]